jgi:hypothetical protein
MPKVGDEKLWEVTVTGTLMDYPHEAAERLMMLMGEYDHLTRVKMVEIAAHAVATHMGNERDARKIMDAMQEHIRMMFEDFLQGDRFIPYASRR